ncbi:BlaI/MecI/CopY family transcriptional regulator [Streptomyces sp. ISL-14]|nr:BlaI/MecI/CopY family transcriptional regulator [Streptomyces sp. ISL-14]
MEAENSTLALDRLVKKKVIGVNKNQKVYTFFPLYSQDECQRAETQSFINRIYGGTLKSMMVQFIQEESLSEEEINELRSILDGKTKKPQERKSKSNGVGESQ